jgi:arginyl-tRNA synthetase
MDLFHVVHRVISEACGNLVQKEVLPKGLDLFRIQIEPPRDSTHGDMATNAAMVLAKPAGKNPRQVAELLLAELAHHPYFTKIEVAGAGFINLTLSPTLYAQVLTSLLTEKNNFGRGKKPNATAINVEYVSANPTGPMHVGHGRGAVFGDALARLLAFAGYAVTREYYINDAGAQVDVLARSAFLRYREALGEIIGEIPEGLYPADYLKPIGAKLAANYGASLLEKTEAEWLPDVRAAAIAAMMEMIRVDLAAIGIQHDVFFSERSLTTAGSDKIAAILQDLTARDLIYEGRLPPPKGQIMEDWEDREQTLFRSTQFGDDVDRALLKSDGSYTYFAADIAYHASKFQRGFSNMIDVWGADHGGYVKRMQAAVKAISNGQASLDVKLCQLVKLMREGEPVKMSKRAGDFVTLRDVIDEVGQDAVRFMMLFRKNDAPLEFDLAKVLEQSKDNPVFYVQYAHARCVSIFKQARETLPNADDILASNTLQQADFSLLTDEGETAIIRQLTQFPRLIETASIHHEPHRIAFYLYELASQFHSLWNKGKESPRLRFINPEPEARGITTARLGLVESVRQVLENGLEVLGVSAPQSMR